MTCVCYPRDANGGEILFFDGDKTGLKIFLIFNTHTLVHSKILNTGRFKNIKHWSIQKYSRPRDPSEAGHGRGPRHRLPVPCGGPSQVRDSRFCVPVLYCTLITGSVHLYLLYFDNMFCISVLYCDNRICNQYCRYKVDQRLYFDMGVFYNVILVNTHN